MISINEAIKISLEKTKPSNFSEKRALGEALDYRIYADQISKIDMPPFPQSAMDGYALRIHSGLEYTLIGEQKAGDRNDFKLNPGEALRIFTGALVPSEADSIVIQEKVKRENNSIHLKEIPLQNANIRPQAEQIRKGDLALKKGKRLNPASIGFLASLGIAELEVYRKPKIGILSTGNELIEAGYVLKPGQIFESNQIMISAALRSKGIFDLIQFKVKDDLESTVACVSEALKECDYLLISGGISVGDYDFVGRALELNKVSCHFYKVAQKPGKPLWFGSKENKYVFALPGNPAAALSCLHLYVLPSIRKWQGLADYNLEWKKAPLLKPFVKKGSRPQFLKAKLENEKLEILEGQNSSMLHSFALANAICFMDGIKEYECAKGELVNFLKL